MSTMETGSVVGGRAESAGVVREFFELTKPRLSLLSVITAMVGYAASSGHAGKGWGVPAALFLGTSLAAGACGVLNQYMEREHDAAMARTRSRPIPSGAVSPGAALAFGLLLAVAGLGVLFAGTNARATLLAAATIASYLLAYTPLKRHTRWCTVVGSLPGALPPLIGCAAALDGSIDAMGWSLFGLLFAWQIPHFMALAWTYRKDYAEGRFVVSTVVDPSGKDAAWQSLVFTVLMIACSLAPACLGQTTTWCYPFVAGACGAYFLKRAVDFMSPAKRDVVAKKLFLASIAYLPAVLIALLVDLRLVKRRLCGKFRRNAGRPPYSTD